MRKVIWALAVTGTMLAVADSAARADVVLAGPDSNAGTYSTAALATVAGANTVDSGTGLTGISLWAFLGGANAAGKFGAVYGAITTSTPAGANNGNAILRYYLVATNATGQQSVVSLGEIDPNFGGTSSPAPMVAFKNTGGSLLASPELILPAQPGRDLTNLTNLQILSVPAVAGPGGVTTSLNLTGNVAHPGAYTQTDLQNNFTPITNATFNLTGVGLWSFLNPTVSNSLNQIVVTVGSDGYEVVLALAELDPALGGNPNDLLPYAGSAFGTAGVARTLFPNDLAHGRWESNLALVSVVEAPEPASLSLFAGALAAVGTLRRRVFRRRFNAM